MQLLGSASEVLRAGENDKLHQQMEVEFVFHARRIAMRLAHRKHSDNALDAWHLCEHQVACPPPNLGP
jgi:hypothetical protein